jgi:hypothetical protein
LEGLLFDEERFVVIENGCNETATCRINGHQVFYLLEQGDLNDSNYCTTMTWEWKCSCLRALEGSIDPGEKRHHVFSLG